MKKRLIRCCSVSMAVLAMLAGAMPSLAAPDWDIVGIRLGMSPVQARAAMLAHLPNATVTDYTRQFSYSDGVKEQQLPGFLGSITASENLYSSTAETLEVMFSAPPMEQRVIRVIRTLAMHDDPLPMERAVAVVTQKYGKPPKSRDLDNRHVARWDEAGKTVCGGQAPTAAAAWEAPQVDNTPGGISHYGALQRRKQAPADASNCSAALVVSLVHNPGSTFVREMKFVMSDPGYAVAAMRATATQIADEEARARAARQDSGAVPQL